MEILPESYTRSGIEPAVVTSNDASEGYESIGPVL